MRTVIESYAQNLVRYKTLTPWGEVRELEFYAPINGGYVVYCTPDRPMDNSQICERLSTSGPTLIWAGKEPLVELIRRQHKLWRYDHREWF